MLEVEVTGRALAIDIDGTLISSRKRVEPFTRREIVRVVRDFDVKAFIVTARGPESAQKIVDQVGVEASIIAYGGAWVQGAASHLSDGNPRVLLDLTLASADVRWLLDQGAAGAMHCGVYCGDDWHVSEVDYWALREARNTAVWPHDMRLAGLGEREINKVNKVMFRAPVEELVPMEEAIRAQLSDVYVHRSGKVLEIFPAQARKWPALQLLAQACDVSTDDIIAFGDTESDLEMLQRCGHGIAMGNAAPVVKEQPGLEVALTNDEDGIGMILRREFFSRDDFNPLVD